MRYCLRVVLAVGALGSAWLGVVEHTRDGGWSIEVAKDAHADCLFMRSLGHFCSDVTERCAPGCSPTSCAERVKALTTPSGPTQLVTFFEGAVNLCSHEGNRTQVFECAWGQAARAYPDLVSDQCTKNALYATFDSIAFNHSPHPFTEPEVCDPLPTDGSVPSGYYVLQAPRHLLDGGDAPVALGSEFNTPPAHNIGSHEGRVNPILRQVARVADPLECSLVLASQQFAIATTEPDKELARAFADLSVTGHVAWLGGPASSPSGVAPFRAATKGFKREAPGPAYCHALPGKLRLEKASKSAATIDYVCPTVAAPPSDAELVKGCEQALTRAYEVANFLRAGHSRNNLNWIAVSGEDDSPHRPVNVPRSAFPQYDIDVDVPAPLASDPNSRTVRVRSRFTVAQFKAPQSVMALTHPHSLASENPFALAPEPVLSIMPDAEILIFVHGMDSRAEEADDITKELFRQLRNTGSNKNLTVISVDLPTSGYAENLDYQRVSPLSAIGSPDGLDFHATGQTPLLDFIEDFIVGFTQELEKKSPGAKSKIKAVMGGSLGGNMTFRLGRRPGVPWLPKFIVWSPASIWNSLAEGADLLKHAGPLNAWKGANTALDPSDPFALATKNAGQRAAFFMGWDKAIVPLIIPMAQSDTWQSDHYPCKKSGVAAARLDRHETYDANFLAWHWRLGAEQLIYSHQTIDPATHEPRFMSNTKRMLLMCGVEDNIAYNDICGATQRTAPHMTTTPGRALFLDQTGHSVDNERRQFTAEQILSFLDEMAPAGPPPVTTPLAPPPANSGKTLGELCLLPAECESHWCSGFPLRCEAQPTPPPLRSNGQLCAVPSECQSNRCVITCQAQPERRPNGLGCLLPEECLSNRCSGLPLRCEPQPPPPPPRRARGEGCNLPSECQSNTCNFWRKCE